MNIDTLIMQAERAFDQGNWDQCIHLLKKILGEAPDEPDAHGLLAICLYNKRRLYAAEFEINQTLALDPNSALAHYTMVKIQLGRRKFDRAEVYLNRLLELEPEEADYHLLKAQFLDLLGRRGEVLTILNHALSLDPENDEVKVALGEYFLDSGDVIKAEEKAREVLEEYPEDIGALRLMGSIYLRKGNIDEAREHTLWALQQDPTDIETLYVMSAIKTKSNWFLGLWWRFNSYFIEQGEMKTILGLLSLYLIFRIISIFFIQNGQEEISQVISWIWIGFCVYTWIGPSLFNRSLKKELATLEMSEDF